MKYLNGNILGERILKTLCGSLPLAIASDDVLCAIAVDPEEYNRLKIKDECAEMYRQKAEEDVVEFLEELNKP